MNSRFLGLVAFAALINFYSCKKETSQQLEPPPIAETETKFRFILYTTRDFSNVPNDINFKMYIRNNMQIIVDSSLVTLPIKDIPNAANKLVFERTVKGNYEGKYKAGFIYTIEDVGIAWYFDSCNVGTPEKDIEYDFR